MAITKLNYIGTPKGGGAAHLKNAIVYIMNPDKTENDVWIGGNAGNTPKEVFQVMMDTKQRMEKRRRPTRVSLCYLFPARRSHSEAGICCHPGFL